MTHPNQDNHSLLNQIVNHLSTEGSDGMAEAMRLLLNHAMQIERSKALGAAPYERSSTRKGHANGFKPKTLQTRLGELTVEVEKGVAKWKKGSEVEKGVVRIIVNLLHSVHSGKRGREDNRTVEKGVVRIIVNLL